ncbi:cationic amino acid transporter [Raphidocelis subcapitata]|uniref:Cationic amino acid transporter n=1 Tax=Raphidocelis subcapitata TaxID=307507 RepID=A0A2V0P9X1_9CHLO|nr:cationic amino acid transporter [Raphidocelis subcapitata]|eukprot:GBF96644.1 cationic amino acid transporter [Raphidocelis subcapitata]
MVRTGSYGLVGFESLKDYGKSLLAMPTILSRRAFSPLMPADAVVESGAAMKQVLGAFDLICLGIGMMLGAGVFVTTGYVAANIAGPAVIISYIVAGISAMLSSFCYAEFAVDIPCAGGAYTYIAAALGEFLAWLTVSNLIFEYILANAAAVRGFSPYFASLTNKPEAFYIHNWNSPSGPLQLDWWAFGWCLLLSVLLVFGTKESAWFNGIVTVVHVVLVVFIIIAGLIKANPANARPFLPFGMRGAFNGASIVFFSYIGFDAVATAAEETRDARKDLPAGILGSVSIVTVLYTLMAATLVLMVPDNTLLKLANASFAEAFRYVGWQWATYIVAVGALMGIVTTTLVGMYGASRIITGVARDHLIPPVLARVNARFQTPWIAIAIQGTATAVLALLSPFSELADMVSISTLFAFWVVALGLVWRRSCSHGEGGANGAKLGEAAPVGPRQRWTTAALLALLNAGAIIFTLGWKVPQPGSVAEHAMLGVGGGVFLLSTLALHILVKPTYTPPRYTAPLYPWLPALSMAFNIFLLGQLSDKAYERFGIWTAVCIAGYFLYSGAASYNKAQRDASALPLRTRATALDDGGDAKAAVEMTAGGAP